MTATETTTEAKAAAPKMPLSAEDRTKKRALRRRTRKAGREKLALKLQSDKEFKKAYFEARSKRSTEKKSAFRKKKSKKK